jgi:hypothetical protein
MRIELTLNNTSLEKNSPKALKQKAQKTRMKKKGCLASSKKSTIPATLISLFHCNSVIFYPHYVKVATIIHITYQNFMQAPAIIDENAAQIRGISHLLFQ